MNGNTPDGRIRRYGFEVVANVFTIAAIGLNFWVSLAASAAFPAL
jgi:hypothetical protein